MKTIKLSALVLTLTLFGSCNSAKKENKEAIADVAEEKVESMKKEPEMKKTGAFLEITLRINDDNRAAAVGVYTKYREPFLTKIDGAISKDLLVRTDDVQVIHGFATEAQANAYLATDLFAKDIVGELGPLLAAEPEVRIYATAAAADKYPENTGAFLQISLKVEDANRPAAAGVYTKYRAPFLSDIGGALSKELLIRGEDVQVLHGFANDAQANAYLSTDLFAKDIVGELGPLLAAEPEVRIYSVFKN